MTIVTTTNLKKLDIEYRDKDHSYIYRPTGKLFAGVSSVASLAKNENLTSILNQWAANCAINHIWQFFGELKTQDNAGNYIVGKDIIEQILKEAKIAHRNLSKEAKDIGTQVHDLLEQYIRGKIYGKEADIKIKDHDTERAFKQFLDWEKANKVEWLATEMLVGNEDLELAGRLDALANVNGQLTIIDWKVANNVSESFYLQLTGYWLCLEWMGCQPEARLIVRIPKTATKKQWNNKDKKYEIVENNLEVIEPPTDINFDKQTFEHLRFAYKWLNQQVLQRK